MTFIFSLVSYMQLTSGQVQADAPTEHIHQSCCYPESSQLDADLLWQDQVIPYFLFLSVDQYWAQSEFSNTTVLPRWIGKLAFTVYFLLC